MGRWAQYAVLAASLWGLSCSALSAGRMVVPASNAVSAVTEAPLSVPSASPVVSALPARGAGMAVHGHQDNATPRAAEPVSVLFGLGGVLVAALVALAMGWWSIALRRAVALRTAELSDERQRLRTLIDALPDPVWLKGQDGLYLACNARFEHLVGRSETRLLQRSAADLFEAATAASLLAGERETLALGKPCTAEVWLNFRHGGYRGLFDTVFTPMRDAHGRLTGVLGMARDVTPQHDAQQRLERLNRLYRMLVAAGDHLAAARGQRALFEAACRTITSEGGLAMAWVLEVDPASGRPGAMVRAGRGTDHAERMYELLQRTAVPRCPTARAVREGQAVVVNDVSLADEAPHWRDAATQRGFRSAACLPVRGHGPWGSGVRAVITVMADSVGFFDAEERRVLELLADQLGAALDTMEADAARGRAEAELRASELRFSQVFRHSPVGMTLGQLDDGRIIDVNDAWLALFGRRRADVIGRNGTDIGLWDTPQARREVYARMHGDGRVEPFEARMRRADGTVVVVSFAGTRMSIGGQHVVLTTYAPVAPKHVPDDAGPPNPAQYAPLPPGSWLASPAGVPAPWPSAGQRLAGLHLLCAEDNPVNQVVLESALTMEGATVELVDNGRQAVERVAGGQGQPAIHLVLMDMQMPEMDGLEATRRIRALVPDLPVVGQTAEALPEERDRCLAAGMVAHVTKPTDLELLVSTVLRHARRGVQVP